MTVSRDQVRPGAVFLFKTAARRVIQMTPLGNWFRVDWEYADGQKRGGRLTGSMWGPYFLKEAIEEIPDPGVGEREVEIVVRTQHPHKWAFVDLETGDLWGHDGNEFKRLDAEKTETLIRSVAAAAYRNAQLSQ